MPPFTRPSRRLALAYPTLALAALVLAASVLALPAAAQETPFPGTRNIDLLGRLTLAELQGSASDAGGRTAGEVVMEQEPDRPYAYVARRAIPAGFYAVDVADPAAPRLLTAVRVGAPNTHAGVGATGLTYFRLGDQVYLAVGYRFDAGSPGAGRGLVVYDVTDPAAPREVAAVDAGPMDNVFAYKRAPGDVLLFAAGGGDVHVYDAARLAAGDAAATDGALLSTIPTPPLLQNDLTGFNDMYVAFHPETETDRMYAAGAGGYHVFDVTDLAAPSHLTSINSAAIRRGLHASATPNGRFVVTTPRYRTAPMRVFDLRPALDGEIPEVRTAVGAWTANWKNVARDHALRWPYVFVASLEDGFHVFNMRDPANPYTVGYYRTWLGPEARMADPEGEHHGAWGVDVRNRDGLIAVSDTDSGLWLFRLDEFDGWDGRGWGLPNVSTVQDWEAGPAATAYGY